MMRVAVVGAHGVGKSTLVHTLSPLLDLPVPPLTEMREPEPHDNKSLSACTDEEMLQLCLRRSWERAAGESEFSSGFISDGSILHEWIYAALRVRFGQFPGPHEKARPAAGAAGLIKLTDAFLLEAVHRLGLAYTLVVHVPIEFPQRRPQPISERFRREADALTRRLVTGSEVQSLAVAGSVAERAQQVRAVLDSPTVRSGSKS